MTWELHMFLIYEFGNQHAIHLFHYSILNMTLTLT
jgi:hypothetical protein